MSVSPLALRPNNPLLKPLFYPPDYAKHTSSFPLPCFEKSIARHWENLPFDLLPLLICCVNLVVNFLELLRDLPKGHGHLLSSSFFDQDVVFTEKSANFAKVVSGVVICCHDSTLYHIRIVRPSTSYKVGEEISLAYPIRPSRLALFLSTEPFPAAFRITGPVY